MATFVLVHGAMHGGWCWRDVQRIMRDEGHEVFTPTLTGQGERAHLLTPETSVDTHVDDIVNVLRYEDLSDVNLVFHSYSGGLIGPVVDRARERVRSVTAIGAFLVPSGMSNYDMQPKASQQMYEQMAAEFDGWRIPVAPAMLERWGITDPQLASLLMQRLTPFSINFTRGRVEYDEAVLAALPRTYIEHTSPPLPPLERSVQWARDHDWRMLSMEIGHDMMLIDPEATARILVEAALPST